MLDDVLFFASVLTFSAAAILGYWQILRADAAAYDEAVPRPAAEREPAADPVPSAL